MSVSKREYKPGDVLSTKIPVNTDEKTLNWINEQNNISKSIFNLISQYANRELLHFETVGKMLGIANSQVVDSNGIKKDTKTKPETIGVVEKQDHRDEDIHNENYKITPKKNEDYLKKEPALKFPRRKMPFKPAEITKGIHKNDDE